MRKALFFGLIAFGFFVWALAGSGCANIIPPSGGPRDSLPPQLERATPADSTVNFHANSITFTFDEFIAELIEPFKNILYTPTFEVPPIATVKGRTVTVPLKNLEPNTTYVIDFGSAISDVNEGNVLHHFTYTFSTGPVLDSLTINGRVVLAETGGIDSTLIAVLHTSLKDSAVMNERPKYVVRLDRDGAFHFHNLPSDSFAIYVMSDPSSSHRYQLKTQLFGFANTPVISGKTDSLVLYAYREVPLNPTGPGNQSILGAAVSRGNDRRLRFTPPATPTQDLLSDYILSFTVPLPQIDSSKIHLSTDSLFQPARFSTSLDSTRKELHFKTQWKENTRYNLVLEKDFATDTSGRQLLKTDTLFFTTKKNADYGKLSIHIRNIDSTGNPVLQFVQNNQVVFSTPISSGTYQNNFFLPGDYELRILYDRNGNGKWDPGKFFEGKRQPEIVKPLNQRLTVKTDWDNELDFTM
jgi:Bacterial Ig-like domain